MSKDDYVALLDSAFNEGTPFINMTEFYSYALIPQGDKYLEVSYDFEDKAIMDKTELSATDAYNHLCEEVEKAMCEEILDFMLVTWKEFKAGAAGSDAEKVKASIEELVNNHEKYSKNFPVVYNKDDLDKVKAKL